MENRSVRLGRYREKVDLRPCIAAEILPEVLMDGAFQAANERTARHSYRVGRMLTAVSSGTL